jgi:hypothetical protein
MKAKLLMTLLLAGEALAADLPAPFHHVRIATFQVDATPSPATETALLKSWLKGPTAIEVGATKRINKHFEYSWTTMRQSANERYFHQPGNAAQQWTSAAKIEFRF